jgi:hypothetical protein
LQMTPQTAGAPPVLERVKLRLSLPATTIFVAAAALFGNWLWPYYFTPHATALLATSRVARDAVLDAHSNHLPVVAVDLSPFVTGYLHVKERGALERIFPSLSPQSLASNTVQVRLRWDNIALGIAGLAILLLVLKQLQLAGSTITPRDVTHANTAGGDLTADESHEPSAGLRDHELNAFPDAELTLSHDVARAAALAGGLFSRSTLLLSGGIVMSFVGIAVFWAALPTFDAFTPDTPLYRYIMLTLRPVGMLIFVEAIAWFLLRQYRALIEDYKLFHRLYLRRANLLVAVRLIKKPAMASPDILLLATLLTDDVSARLKSSEDKETSQALKHVDQSPILELLAKVLDRLPR